MKYITKPILIRYYETDQMGFVHHSNYLRYFELARIEWLSYMGLSYQEMEKKGILMPVIKAKINFKKPLIFGKSFKVKIEALKIPKVKFKVNYEVIGTENEIIATGSTILVFLSANNLKPIRCPGFFSVLFK